MVRYCDRCRVNLFFAIKGGVIINIINKHLQSECTTEKSVSAQSVFVKRNLGTIDLKKITEEQSLKYKCRVFHECIIIYKGE